MGQPSKVIIVCSIKSSFIEKDISLLKKLGCKVITICSPPRKNLFLFVFNRLREFAVILFHGLNSSIMINWFNDYHAAVPIFLSKLLRTPSLIISGGYDTIKLTKIGGEQFDQKQVAHGLFSKKNIRQGIGRFNYHAADYIWVVHKSLRDGCPTTNKSDASIESGILTFIPELKTPIEEVPTSYDSTFWTIEPRKRASQILTVGVIQDERRFFIKGIPLFIELAKLMPAMNFKIIGIAPELAEMISIPKLNNLTCQDAMDQSQLLHEYQNSTFYFQGSLVEGLPNVLCEAMLCGCIPIGRPIFGIPDAIGDTGYLVQDSKNLQPVVDFIRNADPNLGYRARERIITHYPLSQRVSKFKSLLSL